MNMQADPLAFLENYKRIKKLRGFSTETMGRMIYEFPIGPLPGIYAAPIGPVDLSVINPDVPKEEVHSKVKMLSILREVCKQYDISRMDVLSDRRDALATKVRHIVMYRCRKETGNSFPKIGRFLGRKDHTTVLHAVRKIQSLIDSGELVL